MSTRAESSLETLRRDLRAWYFRSPAAAAKKLRLLLGLVEAGSINRAAKLVGVSYKTAWTIVEELNNLAESELFSRTVGGTSGGGTVLTTHGRDFLQALTEASQSYQALVNKGSRAEEAADFELPQTNTIDLGTNQYLTRIRSVVRDSALVQLELAFPTGEALWATSPRASIEMRDLTIGRPVLAQVHPAAIIVFAGNTPRISADNQLMGRVKRLRKGPVNSELCLGLKGGRQLTIILTQTSVERLELCRGAEALAAFTADALIAQPL